VNRRGTPGTPSVEAFVDFALAPSPPTNLEASAGDGIVGLSWQAPATPEPAGSVPVQGFNVYRGIRSGDYANTPLNGRPLAETRFRDAGVENETTYYYVVRSVGSEGSTSRESPNSNEISARPQDFTPPAPPRGLVAVPGTDGVALTWDANPESDLLGYLVYRREPSSLTAVRLVETPIRASTFTDRAARPGLMYLYSLTAVDRSPHRNESAPSSEVSASLH
jgi:hypothetical protein